VRRAWIAAAGLVTASFLSGAQTVGRFDALDIPLPSDRVFKNAWRDVQIVATLTSPGGRGSTGRSFEVAGFLEAPGRWVIRASFDETGVWNVTTKSTPPYPEFATTRQI